jgi:hypothetical protein
MCCCAESRGNLGAAGRCGSSALHEPAAPSAGQAARARPRPLPSPRVVGGHSARSGRKTAHGCGWKIDFRGPGDLHDRPAASELSSAIAMGSEPDSQRTTTESRCRRGHRSSHPITAANRSAIIRTVMGNPRIAFPRYSSLVEQRGEAPSVPSTAGSRSRSASDAGVRPRPPRKASNARRCDRSEFCAPSAKSSRSTRRVGDDRRAPILTGRLAIQSNASRRTPDFPASSAAHEVCASSPRRGHTFSPTPGHQTRMSCVNSCPPAT